MRNVPIPVGSEKWACLESTGRGQEEALDPLQ